MLCICICGMHTSLYEMHTHIMQTSTCRHADTFLRSKPWHICVWHLKGVEWDRWTLQGRKLPIGLFRTKVHCFIGRGLFAGIHYSHFSDFSHFSTLSLDSSLPAWLVNCHSAVISQRFVIWQPCCEHNGLHFLNSVSKSSQKYTDKYEGPLLHYSESPTCTFLMYI